MKASTLVEIVEDDRNIRDVYAKYLRLMGYQVVGAGSVAEGFTRACESQPDLVVTDLGLPTIDGWELVRRIRADDRTRHIPIVVLTGWTAASVREKAQQQGCNGFLTKPCLPEALVTEIQGILDKATSTDTRPRQPRE